MKKIFILLFSILFLLFFINSQDIYQLYCLYGGGEYFSNSTGEYCIVNGHIFNAIDYYLGQVPPEYSFCAHFNLSLVVKTVQIGNYTLNVSYCEYPNGTLISPYQLLPPGILSDLILPNLTNSNITNITKLSVTQKTTNYMMYVYIAIGVAAAIIIFYILY